LASSASNSVTPSTIPGAPTIGTATKGNAQATVTFTPPASNGGSAITGYTVTSSPGGITGTGSSSPITVPGLNNGTAYTFTVIASNSNGNSLPSSASNSVTPSTVPDAPTNRYSDSRKRSNHSHILQRQQVTEAQLYRIYGNFKSGWFYWNRFLKSNYSARVY